jgi:hypothetical protein
LRAAGVILTFVTRIPVWKLLPDKCCAKFLICLIPTEESGKNSIQIVPISGGGGFGFSGVAGVEYLISIASLGRAEKFILLRLQFKSVTERTRARLSLLLWPVSATILCLEVFEGNPDFFISQFIALKIKHVSDSLYFDLVLRAHTLSWTISCTVFQARHSRANSRSAISLALIASSSCGAILTFQEFR